MAGYMILLIISLTGLFITFSAMTVYVYVYISPDETTAINNWLEEHDLKHLHGLFKEKGDFDHLFWKFLCFKYIPHLLYFYFFF